ncbi:hypothetical protein HYY70_01700 [Candidatus Woesearchaeota archaeon]|nr:hypothetical protein [Candidatus Woesearchaeota archaeon]
MNYQLKNKMIQINNKMLREMKQFYIEGYGTKKIAKKFNLAVTTTRDYLLKAGVKFRKASKDKFSISQHNRFINLYHKDKSIKQIAQICNISFSTVQRHLIKSNTNLKKRGNPALIKNQNYKELTLEKSYILGVVGPGDGFIEYRKNNGVYRIVLEAVDLNFIKYFIFCLEKVYGMSAKVKSLKFRGFGINDTFRVRLSSKQVVEDILSYNADFKEKTWTIPLAIKNASKEIKSKYLQGFADSQGSVSLNPKQIILCNQNFKGLKEIEELLSNIGIKNISYNKNGVILCNRKNIEIFNELINFNISYKRERLATILNNYKVWKTPEKEILKLKPKIIELRKNGLSFPSIAKELDISTSAAYNHSKNIT